MELPIKSGYVDFSSVSELDMSVLDFEDLFPDGHVSPSWNRNAKKFDQMLADKWALDPDSIPKQYAEYFENKLITPSEIKEFRTTYKLTWHESGNMSDIFLIKKEIHSIVPHRGGRANVKWLKQLN